MKNTKAFSRELKRYRKTLNRGMSQFQMELDRVDRAVAALRSGRGGRPKGSKNRKRSTRAKTNGSAS